MLLEHGIEKGEELMHARNQRHLGSLALLTQPGPKGMQDGIVAHGTQRAHVESGPDSCASSPDEPLATSEATVTVERGNTHQGGELFMRERAQLRQIRQQGERQDRPHPGDTARASGRALATAGWPATSGRDRG